MTLEGGDALRSAIDHFIVGSCAMLVGAADRAVDNSAEYGNERTQFGQPIGQFQAIKHRIADMWIDVQAGRSLAYYAAWVLETDDPDAVRAVSSLKAYCADNYADIFGDDIRNHGGMGFTWDHDGHIYLEQAKAWENFLSSAADHYERVADVRGI